MKNKKLILTEKQIRVLKGEAIINTLFSLLSKYDNYFGYDKPAIKQLLNKIKAL